MKKAIVHYTGYLLSAVGAVVGVSLLSYYVSPADYGRVSLYIAIATLFQYIVRESLGAAILRYSENITIQKSIALQLAGSSFLLLMKAFLSICLFAFVYLAGVDLSELLFGMALLLLLGVSVAGEAVLSAMHKQLACAMHVNLLQWPRFFLAALFYVYVDKSVTSVLAGFALGILLAVIFDILVYWREKPESTNNVYSPALSKDIFTGNTAVIIGFLTWFLAFYERIALEWFHGESYLGIYFVLYQIGFMPVVMLMRSTTTYLFPRLFVNGSIRFDYLHLRNIIAVLALIVVAFLSLAMMHEWLFGWLVGKEYREFSWLLPWLFLAAMLNAFSYMLQSYYYDKDSMKKLLVVKLKASLVCLLLMSFLIWQFSIQGLIAASVIVSVVLMYLTYNTIEKC